jgi:hypothetical protein
MGAWYDKVMADDYVGYARVGPRVLQLNRSASPGDHEPRTNNHNARRSINMPVLRHYRMVC